MKISQKQANLLAKEIFNRLKKTNQWEVKPEAINKVRAFQEKRKELLAKCKIHDDALRAHENTWRSIVGADKSDRIYYSDSVATVTEKLKEKEVPRIQDIEDKIILQSMFAEEGDMEKFLQKVMKEFTKKKAPIFAHN